MQIVIFLHESQPKGLKLAQPFSLNTISTLLLHFHIFRNFESESSERGRVSKREERSGRKGKTIAIAFVLLTQMKHQTLSHLHSSSYPQVYSYNQKFRFSQTITNQSGEVILKLACSNFHQRRAVRTKLELQQ